MAPTRTTYLKVAEEALRIHSEGEKILKALVEIEKYRESTLAKIRKHQARGNEDELNKESANLVVLNQKRTEAIVNYGKYILYVKKIMG